MPNSLGITVVVIIIVSNLDRGGIVHGVTPPLLLFRNPDCAYAEINNAQGAPPKKMVPLIGTCYGKRAHLLASEAPRLRSSIPHTLLLIKLILNKRKTQPDDQTYHYCCM